MHKNFAPSLFTLCHKLLCDCFKYFQKETFLSMPMVENKFANSHETLKRTGEIKVTMTVKLCLHNFPDL